MLLDFYKFQCGMFVLRRRYSTTLEFMGIYRLLQVKKVSCYKFGLHKQGFA
jgi:hypothetical protein